MSSRRPLRGGCHCGRNRYIIQAPKDAAGDGTAQVLFSSSPTHRLSQATPLAAHIRVPLEWYHSTTSAFFPDETSSMIRRAYSSPRERHALRHFCGFCGTPLSYWSEEPRAEADYIQLTLGSLSAEDLCDLEDLGLVPGLDTPPEEDDGAALAGRETVGGLPWFDALVEGSRLGSVRSARVSGRGRDGNVRVEWEVVEYTEDDGDGTPRSGKRKLDETRDAGDAGTMEDVQR